MNSTYDAFDESMAHEATSISASANPTTFLNELREAYHLLITGAASEVTVKHPVRNYVLRQSDGEVIADALRRLEFMKDPAWALSVEIAVDNGKKRTAALADQLIEKYGGDARAAVEALFLAIPHETVSRG